MWHNGTWQLFYVRYQNSRECSDMQILQRCSNCTIIPSLEQSISNIPPSKLKVKMLSSVHLRTSSPPLAILATAGPLAIAGARSLLALARAGPLLAIPRLGAGFATSVVTPIPTSVVAARVTNIDLGAASPGASQTST
jgi:hypothetical protein